MASLVRVMTIPWRGGRSGQYRGIGWNHKGERRELESQGDALPTRDARRGRLYTLRPGTTPSPTHNDWFKFIYLQDDKHVKTNRPLDESCDCRVCQRYTIGYLHHLYKQSEVTFMRLATLHNLRFMMCLMESLRGQSA